MELLQLMLEKLWLKLIKKYCEQSQRGLTYDLKKKWIPLKIYINNADKEDKIYGKTIIRKPSAWNIEYGYRDRLAFGVAMVENEYASENIRNQLLSQVYYQLRLDGFTI